LASRQQCLISHEKDDKNKIPILYKLAPRQQQQGKIFFKFVWGSCNIVLPAIKN
jgi:hypothetical protein